MGKNEKLGNSECGKGKWKAELTLLLIGAIIQLLVCLGIFSTVFFTWRNTDLTREYINQQGDFNRNFLKPWVYVIPVDSIFVKDDTLIYWWYDLKCFGSSPALNVRAASVIDTNRYSPFVRVDTTKQYDVPLNYIEEDIETYLVPGEKKRRVKKGRKLSELNLSKKDIKEKVNKGYQLYYHLYVDYETSDTTVYFVDVTLCSNNMKPRLELNDLTIYDVRWTWIDVEHGIRK